MNAQTRALIRRHIGEENWRAAKRRAEDILKDTLEAERLQTQVQWAWGDLSLELIPIVPAGGDHSLVAVLIGAFMEDFKIPWSKTTMHSIRQTAAAWPKAKRKKTSFAVHKILKSHPDRFELIKDGMTTLEAMALMGRKRTEATTYTATAIECANAVKSWSKALKKRLPEEPDEALLGAITEAFSVMTEIVSELDIELEVYD